MTSPLTHLGKISASAVGLVALFMIPWSAFEWAEGRYASKPHVILVEQRLDVKIAGDLATYYQRRIWKMEDRHGEGCVKCSVAQRQEYRELKEELRKAQAQVKRMQAQR